MKKLKSFILKHLISSRVKQDYPVKVGVVFDCGRALTIDEWKSLLHKKINQLYLGMEEEKKHNLSSDEYFNPANNNFYPFIKTIIDMEKKHK